MKCIALSIAYYILKNVQTLGYGIVFCPRMVKVHMNNKWDVYIPVCVHTFCTTCAPDVSPVDHKNEKANYPLSVCMYG